MLSLLVIILAVRLFQTCRSPEAISLTRYCFRAGTIVLTAVFAAGAVALVKYDVVSSQIGLLLAYQKPGLRRWGESFTSTFLFQVHPVVTVSAIFSMYVAWKKKDPKYLVICWLMALMIALQIKRIRYMMSVFPMFSLMAAYGLNALRGSGLKRCVVFSVAACSLTLAVFAYLPFMHQTSAQNLLKAGAFLDTLPGKNIEVITLARKDDDVNIAVSVPILDLFTGKSIHYTYRMEGAPPPEKIAVSPLRFTWAYKNPYYYSGNPTRVFDLPGHKSLPSSGTAVTVIAGELVNTLPEEVARAVKQYKNSKSFRISDDIFEHQTLVNIYY
jgi:hypothetical protein